MPRTIGKELEDGADPARTVPGGTERPDAEPQARSRQDETQNVHEQPPYYGGT
jgi:hypothetical protein